MKEIILFLALISIILITGCIKQNQQNVAEENLREKCCKECEEAFSQSPVGVGPAGVNCGMFTTGKPLSEECEKYFEENVTRVSECI